MSSVFKTNKDHLNSNQNLHVDFDVTLVNFDTKSFETPDSTAREGEPPLDIANSVIVKASTTPAKAKCDEIMSFEWTFISDAVVCQVICSE